MRCLGNPHLERRVEGFGPVAFLVPLSSGGAFVEGVPPEIELEALTLPTTQELMRYKKRGHDDIIYVCTDPRGVDPAPNQVFDQGTGEFPLPLVGQLDRERGREKRTRGLRFGHSVTKRAIPFRARQNGQERRSGVRADWSDDD
ncbi:hypothetical protein HAX54_006618 [Datura stramonium]|uniref:Restriction endonuclease domain-containing protein n=1 Tax=Datura stramonium TaxID=4076 RepID=A0ABS8WW83_DATST|nr:hypothetical protein [Datura stramonium]